MSRVRVLHAITGLQTGGAEVLLARVLEALAGRTGVEPAGVISLTDRGPLTERVEAAGAPVTAIDLRRPTPPRLLRLRRAIRAAEADVVQTWLLHANVIAGSAARLGGGAPVAWGVHITEVQAAVHGRVAASLQRAERALAGRVPATIVACSESSEAAMRGLGYPESKVETIANGFDIDAFHPQADDREAMRNELGVAASDLVVGHVARFHPMKDQANLLAAARIVCDRVPGVRFMLSGRGLDAANTDLAPLVAGLGDRVTLLGERADVQRLYRAFDLLALSSAAAEALPLVVGEAMASGTPVVATDCGDSRYVIGDTGKVVPPRDPAALAQAIGALLERGEEGLAELGVRARARIARHYSLDGMVDAYVGIWRRLAGRPRAA